MRKLIAKIVVAFAHLVTLPLSSSGRRADARARAGNMLVEGNVAEVTTDRGRLFFSPEPRMDHALPAKFRTYEPDTLNWIDMQPDDAVFWDIGANIGGFSLYAGLGPGAAVLAFEPAAGSFAVLNRNIELNGMADRIKAYCVAFAADTKLDSLNMAETAPGTGLHGFGSERDQLGRPIDVAFRQGALGFSVDDFVATFSPPLPTHVKIDVDGIEADILRGGRRTFSAPSVRSMIVEIEGGPGSTHDREILGLMGELGFTARPKASPRLRNVIFDRCPPRTPEAPG